MPRCDQQRAAARPIRAAGSSSRACAPSRSPRTGSGTRRTAARSARPRASLAMIQATGNATSSVSAVASADMQRGAHEHVPVERLAEEGPVLREARRVLARRDALAERQQRQIDVRQDDQREQPQQRRREQQRRASAGACQALPPRLRHGCRGAAKQTARSRIEAEGDRARRPAGPRSAPVCGSAMRNSKRLVRLAQQHRGVGAVEQQALRPRRSCTRLPGAAARRRARRGSPPPGARRPRPPRRRAIAAAAPRARTRQPPPASTSTESRRRRCGTVPAMRLLAPTKPATNGVAGE